MEENKGLYSGATTIAFDRPIDSYKNWCPKTETIFELKSNSNDDWDAFGLKDEIGALWPDQGRLEVIDVSNIDEHIQY